MSTEVPLCRVLTQLFPYMFPPRRRLLDSVCTACFSRDSSRFKNSPCTTKAKGSRVTTKSDPRFCACFGTPGVRKSAAAVRRHNVIHYELVRKALRSAHTELALAPTFLDVQDIDGQRQRQLPFAQGFKIPVQARTFRTSE